MEEQDTKTIHTADIFVAENYLFTKFLLSEKLQKALKELNYIKPSPIQLKIIPLVKSRLDMIIQSKSGTGKTLAFSICLLEDYDENLRFPQALIIVPTREIAVQITNILNGLGKYLKHFKSHEFIGGTDMKVDRKKIQNAKIVIGTPGRLLHLIKNEIFNISNIKSIVLDEADKLLESGQMAKDVKSILKTLALENKQIIAATATVTREFENHIKSLMKNPIGITPKQEIPVLLGIKQFIIQLPDEDDNIQLMHKKIVELEKIFTRITFKQCLLFTDSQSKTESYGNYLSKAGWKNDIINGSQEQSQRLKVLSKLSKFKCRILITTDLMARGIDIENVNLVIHLDLPYDSCTYLHRIGRAGRFATHGLAITIINNEKDLIKFQKMLNEIGDESMVYKFPTSENSINFWDFKSFEKLERLEGFSNGEIIKTVANGNHAKTENEIIDENLILLEITKKLVDQNCTTENEINNFDPTDLLDEYAKSCKIDQVPTNGNSSNDSDIASNKNECVMKDFMLKEPKEKRVIIFKQDPKNDDEILSESESEEEEEESESELSVESNDEEDDDDYGLDQNKSHRNNAKMKNNIQFAAQSSENPLENEAFQYYNQLIAQNYSQWRNIFNFQLANIRAYAYQE